MGKLIKQYGIKSSLLMREYLNLKDVLVSSEHMDIVFIP